MDNKDKLIISGITGSISGLIGTTLLAIAIILTILKDELASILLIAGLIFNLFSVVALEFTNLYIEKEKREFRSKIQSPQ